MIEEGEMDNNGKLFYLSLLCAASSYPSDGAKSSISREKYFMIYPWRDYMNTSNSSISRFRHLQLALQYNYTILGTMNISRKIFPFRAWGW